MDEKSKRLWKRVWHSRRWFRAWLISAAVISGLVAIFWGNLGVDVKIWSDWPLVLAAVFIASMIMLIAAVPVALWIFLRWLCCWRNCKRFLLGCVALAALIVLFYAEEDWRGWHAWNQFKHEWEAKGEHFDFASVVPPPVPDDQNFALTPVVASCYAAWLDKNGHRFKPFDSNVVNRLAMSIYHEGDIGDNSPNLGSWQKAQLADLRIWQEYYRHPKTNSSKPNATVTNDFSMTPEPQTPAADVLLALSKYDATIEDLRLASRLPAARFPLTYDIECPVSLLLPHLSAMKNCSRILHLRAIAELQNSQSEKALADVKLMLRLDGAIHPEPFLISHLVRISILQMMLQPVYEGLAQRRWTDEQLVDLDTELTKLDFLADYGKAMRCERIDGIMTIDYFRNRPNARTRMAVYYEGTDGWKNSRADYVLLALAYGPSGWCDQNKLRSCRYFGRWFFPAVDNQRRVFLPSILRDADLARDREFGSLTPCNLLEWMLMPALGSCATKCARVQSSVDLARTAIALERYRLAHGEYPESLAVLAPQFIAKVPHDVIGGQPLKYRRTADKQFVLYSVGWNEKDDGGVVVIPKGSSQPKYDEGDWVWRYPQK